MKMSTKSRLVAVGFLVLGAALAVSAVAAATPAKAPKNASLVIRHQTRGCHAWSLNGGKFIVNQKVRLARGGSLTLTNNDLMAQELVKKSGPAVKERLIAPFGKSQVMMGMDDEEMGMPGPQALTHMGARLRVTFPTAGTYRFGLVDRGDYMEVKTIGEDNVLTLTAVVR